jgi:hypothetical protein
MAITNKAKSLIASILKKKSLAGKLPKGKSAESVKERKQAIAIAMSEARHKGFKIPKK